MSSILMTDIVLMRMILIIDLFLHLRFCKKKFSYRINAYHRKIHRFDYIFSISREYYYRYTDIDNCQELQYLQNLISVDPVAIPSTDGGPWVLMDQHVPSLIARQAVINLCRVQSAYICIITATFCHVCNDMACVCCWYTGFSMFKGSEFSVNTDCNTCLLHNGTITERDTIGRKRRALFGPMK